VWIEIQTCHGDATNNNNSICVHEEKTRTGSGLEVYGLYWFIGRVRAKSFAYQSLQFARVIQTTSH
jgi:hypothetical protein